MDASYYKDGKVPEYCPRDCVIATFYGMLAALCLHKDCYERRDEVKKAIKVQEEENKIGDEMRPYGNKALSRFEAFIKDYEKQN